MTDKEKLKAAALAELQEGLRNGTITIKVVTTCGHCLQEFDSDEAYQAHLESFVDYMKRVHNTVVDPAKHTSKVCPLPHPDSWEAKQVRKKGARK